MEINALLMGTTDNVVTCVTDIHAGETVNYKKGNEILSIVAEQDIPYCHKLALVDIPADGEVIKYDESIGKVSCHIKKGHLVDHTNLFSVPRDYDAEMVKL